MVRGYIASIDLSLKKSIPFPHFPVTTAQIAAKLEKYGSMKKLATMAECVADGTCAQVESRVKTFIRFEKNFYVIN